MAKMLRIKSCAQCGECRLGRTANAGIHPNCPLSDLPDAPGPYSESNQPKLGDLVDIKNRLPAQVYGWEWSKGIIVSVHVKGPEGEGWYSIDKLTLLYRQEKSSECVDEQGFIG